MKNVIIVVLVILVAVGGIAIWKTRRQNSANAGEPNAKNTLYVAIPQGVYQAIAAAMKEFKKTHPNVEFNTMVDKPEDMVNLVRKKSENFDIFISPGGHEAAVLRAENYLDPATMIAFGSYDVALLVPKGNPGKIHKLEDLASPSVKVISFSYPDLTSASYAARQSLQNLGIWDKVEKKVKVAGNCMDSFVLIVQGKAEANVQFIGCPLDPKSPSKSAKAEVALTFPRNSLYIPRTVAGMSKTAANRKLAKEFLAFLATPESIQLMVKNRLRNDQELPFSAGPWGPEQEKITQAKQTVSGKP